MPALQDVIRRIQIQASQTGADQTSTSLLKLAGAQNAVAVATTNAEKATLSIQGKLNSLQRSIDAEYASEQKMAAVEKTLTAARNEGIISAQRETQLLDLASAKYRTAGQSAEFMTKSLDTAKEAAMGLLTGLGAGVALGSLSELPTEIMEMVKSLAELKEQAETIGITTTKLQELEAVGKQYHIAVNDMADDLDRFSKNLGIAATGTGKLNDILKANHVTITGDLMKDFENYATLIENSTSAEQRNLLTTTAFGKSAQEMGNMFEDGGAGIQRAADAADQAGEIFGGDALTKAKELDTAFINIKTSFDTLFEDIAVTTAPSWMADLNGLLDSIRMTQYGFDQMKQGNVGNGLAAILGQHHTAGASPDQLESDVEFRMRAGAADMTPGLNNSSASDFYSSFPQLKPLSVSVHGAHTITPNTAADAAAKSQAKRLKKAYDDLVVSAQNDTATLNTQADALGLTTSQAAKLEEQTKLLNKARKDGIDLSPDQVKAIDSEAQAYADAKTRLDELSAVYNDGKEAFTGFFDTLTGDLQQGQDAWSAFSDAAMKAIDDVLQKAVDAAANSAFDELWTGGSSGGGGGIGGFISGLLGLGGGTGQTFSSPMAWAGLAANAKGGVYASPSLSAYSNSIVSEPTYFAFANGGAIGVAGEVPGKSEAILPLKRGPDGQLGVASANGNAPATIVYSPTYQINAQGAQAGVADQIMAAFEQYDRQLPIRLKQIQADPRKVA